MSAYTTSTPFSPCTILPVQAIVKANIFRKEDVPLLLNALSPLVYISNPDMPTKASSLHSNVISKLAAKPRTIELLQHFGYIPNPQGSYVFVETETQNEANRRKTAAVEFRRFYDELQKAKNGQLNGFEAFLNGNQADSPGYHPPEPTWDFNYQNPPSPRTESRDQPNTTNSNARSHDQRSRLPNHKAVEEGNKKTRDAIKAFKQEIKSRYDSVVPGRSFVRRKLLLRLVKQVNPQSAEFGEDFINDDIDQKLHDLRNLDRRRNNTDGDEIYVECFLRSNFQTNVAREILQQHRPNLNPPQVQQLPSSETTTTIDDCLPGLEDQWENLNADTDENIAAQPLLHEGDEWKNAMYIVPAIIELRNQYDGEDNYGIMFSKIYRLIYSELSSVVGQQSIVKIEMLVSALCEIPFDSVQHLDVADIKDILRSCKDYEVDENFKINALRSLSIECPICMESFPRSQMDSMLLCEHTCCINCTKQYYRDKITAIRNSEALKQLTCPIDQHEIPQAPDEKMNFFQCLETKLKLWFASEQLLLDKYHENLFHATRDAKFNKCGNPKCSGFFEPNSNRIARALCPHCQFTQCQQCCRKWNEDHRLKSCEEYSEWLKENDPDDPQVQLQKYLNTAAMACPSCQAIYEYRPGGCEHFTCARCRTEFCRICSELFYNKTRICPVPNCDKKNTLHAHCVPNCYREIRDADANDLVAFLNANNVNVAEELKKNPVSTNDRCPVEDCKYGASVECENRFCEVCYKQFLCLLVWRHELDPWQFHSEHQLRTKLASASIAVPADATMDALVQLAKQHLRNTLGKPKKLPKATV